MAKRKKRKKPTRSAPAKPLDPDFGPWAYWLFVIAAFGWAIWANNDLLESEETLRWRETTGTIAHTKITTTTSGGSTGNSSRAGGGHTSSSTTWHVNVSYRYEVDGQALSGDRIAWSGGWSYGSESEARAKVRELEARKTIPVFYDRARPSRAVLVRGADHSKLVLGVLMIGGAFGLLIFKYLEQRPPEKRRGSLVKQAILGGFAAAVVFGGVQYLVYMQLFG